MSNQTIKIFAFPQCELPAAEPGESDAFWADIPQLPAPDGDDLRFGEPAATAVRGIFNQSSLLLRFDCGTPDPRRLAPPKHASPLTEADHLELRIHPHCDPTAACVFRADLRGMRQAERVDFAVGECSLMAVPDTWQQSRKLLADWHLYHGVTADCWHAEFVIPWSALGLSEAPPNLGLAYKRVYRTGEEWPAVLGASWPASASREGLPAMASARLGVAAATPTQLTLQAPVFGHNRATLEVSTTAAGNARISVLGADGSPVSTATFAFSRVTGTVDLEFPLRRAGSSHAHVFDCPRLQLELLVDGTCCYRARMPIDRHLGVLVDEPYGDDGQTATKDLRTQWLSRVTGCLPKLSRRSTNDGAPSDFCLVDETGGITVNLMADDAWAQLAAIVESRFDSVEERLLGAMALIGQKSVTNLILRPMFADAQGRQTYHIPLHEALGPLSIIRYGGGPAVARAAALAGLLQRLRNPQTGEAFVTRVVALDLDGGPRQAGESYRGCQIRAPFVQEPGPIGAVAVDHDGSQTLLDPTALAFFPIAHGRLATVEKLTGDPALARAGAGRLAAAYAGLDIEEMRRHLPDQLLSRGVFPELCQDEDGSESTADIGYCQSLRPVVAPAAESGCAVEAFVTASGAAGVRACALQARHSPEGLALLLQVRGMPGQRMSGRDLAAERVHVAIDPTHEHAQFYHYRVGLDGQAALSLDHASAIQTMCKHLSTENHNTVATLAADAWTRDIQIEADGYRLELTVPWPALSLRGDRLPGVIGLNVWVDGRTPHYEQVFLQPPRWRLPACPFSFADLYLGNPTVVCTEIDFGIPRWGENRGRLIVANRCRQAVMVSVPTTTAASMQRSVQRRQSATVALAADQSATIAFPFYLDPGEKMTSGRSQRLTLDLQVDGQSLGQHHWLPNYCGTLGVYQRFGEPPQDLDPADLPAVKTAQICSRLHQFRRLTTRDGAVSDFVLRSHDGEVEFNLMQPGVMRQIAAYVESRFQLDVDRVLGVLFLTQQPEVARHISFGHRLMEGAGPLSILRGNFAGAGGNCGYHSRAATGVLACLEVGGKRLAAHTLGVWGHCITAIAWRDSKVLIDADVGHFMLTADGNDFATCADLRSGRPILSTANAGELGRYVTFSEAYTLGCPPYESDLYAGTFPPGAPAE